MRRHESDGRPFRILCAARFVEKKGHTVLIKAFANVQRQVSATLTVIGYGPLLPHIEALIARLGVAERVNVINMTRVGDFHELYPSLLAEHDVFALTSTVGSDGDDEGGPALTAICAQATGMPVVLTRFPGAERSVEHDKTGLLCEYDAADVAEQLIALAHDRQRCAAIGEAGAARVRSEFALNKQLAELQQIYHCAIADRESRDNG
jgi:glycosyltransferase involved in cell wall biosynthesis